MALPDILNAIKSTEQSPEEIIELDLGSIKIFRFTPKIKIEL
jgi:hypothetical protein